MGLLDFLGQGATFENGKVSQKGSGILGWIGENPALFSGYATAALGSSQGMSGMESMSLGAQSARGVQGTIQNAQNQAAQNAALQTQATLEQQKLLLDIEKAKSDTRLGNVDAALKEKQRQQEIINKSYEAAVKLFPKDPKAAAKYAQGLIQQNAGGGTLSINPKLLRSAEVIYTPQSTGVAGTNY